MTVVTWTSPLGSRTGSLRSTSALSRLKIALFAPIASVSESRATNVNDGDLTTYWQANSDTNQWIGVTWDKPTHFTVVQLHTDLHDFLGMSPESQRQRLHKHMHNEMQTLEIVAQELADFPEAPWELRMQLARQCWDESK